jgi:hypothetical protein
MSDANEALQYEHDKQKEVESEEYEQMLDELEATIPMNEIVVNFNKIVESYGFDLDITTWIKEK